MPRIPQQSFGTQPNLSRAAISDSAATAQARATIQTGKTISAVGGQFAQLAKAKKEADDAAYVTEAFNNISRTESELFNDLSTKGLDIDLEKGQQDFNDRIKDKLANAPSQEAREALQRQADNMYSRKLFPMFSKYQAKKNIDTRFNSYKSAQDDVLKDLMSGRTSFEEAAGRNEAVLVGMEKTLGGVVDMNKERVNSFSQLSTSYLSERINKGESQAVINEIKEGKWDTYADAKTLGRIVDTARKDIKQRENIKRSSYLAGAKDYINFLKSGQDDEALKMKYTPDEVKKLIKGEQGIRLADDIQDARAFGELMNDIKDATPQQINEILAKETPTTADRFTREASQKNVIVRALQQRNKAIQTDPANYVNQNTRMGQFAFEELQQSLSSGNPELMKQSFTKYNAVQKANQINLGVSPSSVKLLPKTLEDQFVTKLNDTSEGGQGVVEQVNFLKEMYGEDFSLVRNQLVASGNLKGGITVVADMEQGQEQIQVAEAVSISKKDYKGMLEDAAYKEITQDTKLELQEFAATTNDPVFFNEHREAIERVAMKLMVDGIQDDSSDAIQAAMDKVINNRYEFVDNYRIPVKFNSTNVEFGVEQTIEKLKSGEVDLFIPQSAQIANEEDRKAVFLNKLVPFAHTLQDNTGVVFTHKNGDAILKANGEPLVIKFDELEKNTPSFFERFF